MDLVTTTLLVIITYAVFATCRWAFSRHRRLKLLKRYGIPGPEPSFWVGNILHFASYENITQWAEQYGTVFGYYVGEVPYVVISDLDMLKQVFIKDFHVFSNRPEMALDVKPLNKTILALKDKRWKEVRSMLTPTFSSGKIKLMTSIVDKKIDVTLDVISKKAEKNEMFDMYTLVQGLTLDVIADCALAMKTHCQENPEDQFLVAVRDYFKYASNKAVMLAIILPFVKSIMTFVSNHLTAGKMTELIVDNVKSAIDARNKNAGQPQSEKKIVDILQLMMDHREGDGANGMTDEEIIANAYVFILAGYETTATALVFTFYLLIKHPEIQEKLYKEIEDVEDTSYNTIQSLQYLDQVFSESLRCYPPVVGFVSRSCDEDYRIGEHTIPKGAKVLAPVWQIHHNPDLWPDPWKFDPDRFSPENKTSLNSMAFWSFGMGRRNCIGARFAQLEAKLTIFRLVKKFRFEMCEKTDDPLPLICPTVIINPEHGVYLKAVPRTTVQL